MIGLYVSVITGALVSALYEEKQFQEYLKTLPEEEARRIKGERKKKRESEEEHRKKLEIAEAGRPRNFWGK